MLRLVSVFYSSIWKRWACARPVWRRWSPASSCWTCPLLPSSSVQTPTSELLSTRFRSCWELRCTGCWPTRQSRSSTRTACWPTSGRSLYMEGTMSWLTFSLLSWPSAMLNGNLSCSPFFMMNWIKNDLASLPCCSPQQGLSHQVLAHLPTLDLLLLDPKEPWPLLLSSPNQQATNPTTSAGASGLGPRVLTPAWLDRSTLVLAGVRWRNWRWWQQAGW